MKPDLKVAEQLEAIRLKAGLSRVKLGKKMGLSETSVWRRERARCPISLQEIAEWCDICNTKLSKFLSCLK